jgi:hypothetical protein
MEDADTFLLYMTSDRQLFVTDYEGVLIAQNTLKRDNLQKEDERATYVAESNRIKITSIKPDPHGKLIPSTQHVREYDVSLQRAISKEALRCAVAVREQEIKQSWAEYFSINDLVTPYTTENLPVPPAIMQEANERREQILQTRTRKLIDILFE